VSGHVEDERILSIVRALEILEQTAPGSVLWQNLATLLDKRLSGEGLGFQAPTAKGPARLLTIGMATYDDYDGVYFSVQAIRLFHPEVTAQTEILVLDNHPSGPCAKALKQLETYVDGYRYVPYGSAQGTAVRDCLFREASSPFVMSMDSHVLFAPGSLARLIGFLQGQTASDDLWHGPLLGDELRHLSALFTPVWSGGMYGQWGTDERASDPDGPPFEIPMQGAGVFVCRKQAWPGFNSRFTGFGGEEGYLHEKFRRRGGKVWCLPFLRWVHRFNRPMGVPYQAAWKQRLRNYLIGWNELNLDIEPVVQHFEQLLGADKVRPMIESIEREMRGPFHRFDAAYCIARQSDPERWSALDLDAKMRWMPAAETPYNPDIGRALAHRAVLDEAHRQSLEQVLVFDSAIDLPALDLFSEGLAAGTTDGWRLCRLPHAVAYHRRVFEDLLRELPERPSMMALWLRRHRSWDAYLAGVAP
jgi:hypothetical protein